MDSRIEQIEHFLKEHFHYEAVSTEETNHGNNSWRSKPPASMRCQKCDRLEIDFLSLKRIQSEHTEQLAKLNERIDTALINQHLKEQHEGSLLVPNTHVQSSSGFGEIGQPNNSVSRISSAAVANNKHGRHSISSKTHSQQYLSIPGPQHESSLEQEIEKLKEQLAELEPQIVKHLQATHFDKIEKQLKRVEMILDEQQRAQEQDDSNNSVVILALVSDVNTLKLQLESQRKPVLQELNNLRKENESIQRELARLMGQIRDCTAQMSRIPKAPSLMRDSSTGINGEDKESPRLMQSPPRESSKKLGGSMLSYKKAGGGIANDEPMRAPGYEQCSPVTIQQRGRISSSKNVFSASVDFANITKGESTTRNSFHAKLLQENLNLQQQHSSSIPYPQQQFAMTSKRQFQNSPSVLMQTFHSNNNSQTTMLMQSKRSFDHGRQGINLDLALFPSTMDKTKRSAHHMPAINNTQGPSAFKKMNGAFGSTVISGSGGIPTQTIYTPVAAKLNKYHHLL